MEGIDDDASAFLNAQELDKYLSQVAPLKYDAQRFIFAPKIAEWAKGHGVIIPTITLVIKTPTMERQVFKPYKTHYRTRRGNLDIEVRDVRFYPEDVSFESPFWLWYGETDLLGMVDDERVAGLRFRKNNIALGGPERVAELFPGLEGRLNSWLTGEIHVLSSAVIPNARRDGFEQTEDWKGVRAALAPFIEQHCKACHEASGARRPIPKVLATANATIQDVKEHVRRGIVSKRERDGLLKKLAKEDKRTSRSLKTAKRSTDSERLKDVISELEETRKSLERDVPYVVTQVRSDLSRKERKILRESLEIIEETLSSEPCKTSDACFNKLKTAIMAKFQDRKEEASS